jgi:hypothetical protein
MAARIGVHPPSGLPTIEDPSGVPRVLARLAPNPRAPFAAIGRRMALPAPDRWQEIEIVPWEPPHLMNQGQHASCVGHGTCTAFEAAWTQAGQPRPPAPFSGCYIYGWVNGGQDQGAVISDAAASLRMHGVCTEREVPEGLIFLQQFPSAAHEVAGHYRPLSIMKCQTFEDICGALASGFPIVVGIIVGSNFSNLESSGVAPLPDQPLGGHCLAALGLKNHSRYGWCLEVQNSWDRWGIDGKGRCLLRREHFETPTDAFAVVSVATDPGSQPLPVATA